MLKPLDPFYVRVVPLILLASPLLSHGQTVVPGGDLANAIFVMVVRWLIETRSIASSAVMSIISPRWLRSAPRAA